MKKLNLISFILLFITTTLFSNTDRALYVKKYNNESKTALIIGNSNYKYFSKLQNSKNDAYDMQKILKKQGFDVLYLKDGSLRDMKKIVRKFTKKLRNGGVGFFYYSGHGLEVDGNNYLIPTTANIPDKDEVEFEALPMNLVINKMENSSNRLNIVVLDACRNDPYTKSGGGGLAQINNAKGMYISFATAPGSVASDGNKNERNGLFTKHLIKNINKSNLTLNQVFKKTRTAVYDESNDKQLPWTSSSVIGDFYFQVDTNAKISSTIKNTPKENTTFAFNDVAQSTFSLTINPTPHNAKVQIMNISDKYYDGIKLKKGNYNIKVSKNGYTSKEGNINLQSNTTIPISLNKEEVTATPRKSNNSQVPSNPIDKGSYIIPAMVKINAGSFMMGSDSGGKDEKPVHKVTIQNDFYIGKYEITFREYDKFSDDTGRTKPKDKGWGRGNLPVINVSWNDAKAYANWLSQKTNKNYRLPTEAEWEYVARAGTTTKYSWGNSIDCSKARYGYYSDECGKQESTDSVGSFQPNPWGVYDMNGNVYEWCEDWYVDNYNNTPTNGTNNDSGSQKYKVFRGGSWSFVADLLRSASRRRVSPSNSSYVYGFRLVLSSSEN